MPEHKIFIVELVAIDGLATGTVASGKVTALTHEVGNDSVERAVFIPKTGFSCTQLFEILTSEGCYIGFQLHFNPSHVFAADRHVKIHGWVFGIGRTQWWGVRLIDRGVWGRYGGWFAQSTVTKKRLKWIK